MPAREAADHYAKRATGHNVGSPMTACAHAGHRDRGGDRIAGDGHGEMIPILAGKHRRHRECAPGVARRERVSPVPEAAARAVGLQGPLPVGQLLDREHTHLGVAEGFKREQSRFPRTFIPAQRTEYVSPRGEASETVGSAELRYTSAPASLVRGIRQAIGDLDRKSVV